MAIALTAPDSLSVGETLDFSVAGATASGNVKVEITSAGGGLSLTAVVAADAGGAYASTGKLDVIPDTDLPLTVKVTDETGGTTDEATIKVSVSE